VVFDAAVGVGKASISLYLPCMIRGGNLAATNGPEPIELLVPDERAMDGEPSLGYICKRPHRVRRRK
jgi:hypothetical protein